MSNQLETPAPIAEYEATLRPVLNPANAVEEFFFHEIAVNTVLAGFLVHHITADPELENPETVRRIRLLHAYESRRRYAYEELRRQQLARHLQQHDPELAALPRDVVVATHTNRGGLRARPRPAEPQPTPIAKPAAPGRNALCPCGSGRKFKHCCLGKSPLPQAA
ncbi:MAG: SEC-C domain-containing protein [Acidobacteria bacterium]|nr:SEC-C domain-containing protein [Acidobacteriota bacterium]